MVEALTAQIPNPVRNGKGDPEVALAKFWLTTLLPYTEKYMSNSTGCGVISNRMTSAIFSSM